MQPQMHQHWGHRAEMTSGKYNMATGLQQAILSREVHWAGM